MPYSECPTPYSSVFCLRCPTCNSIYTWSWVHLQGDRRSRQMRIYVPFSECPTPYNSMLCLKYPTWNSIFIRSWTQPRQGREFRLENAVIQSSPFGVGHAAIQSYPKGGMAIRSALRRISTLSRVQLRIKSYSGWNGWMQLSRRLMNMTGIFRFWEILRKFLLRPKGCLSLLQGNAVKCICGLIKV